MLVANKSVVKYALVPLGKKLKVHNIVNKSFFLH